MSGILSQDMAARRELARLRKLTGMKAGNNVEAIENLAKYLKSIDESTFQRFHAQVAAAMTLAVEMDNGNVNKSNVYRALIDNIYTRMDKILGTDNMDIIAQLDLRIKQHAEERAKKGWDG